VKLNDKPIALCRFQQEPGDVRVGMIEDDAVVDLAAAGITELEAILNSASPGRDVRQVLSPALTRVARSAVKLVAPVDRQEVWAAGVTYLRSKTARMEESDFSASAYDRVYDADRPELFFKSTPEKVVGDGAPVGIRGDARWSVPEPELALVINSRGAIVGHTIGNDMSSRDIEGENLLYLPQAKVYDRSCALGPWIVLGASEDAARQWTVRLAISRGGQPVFAGQTSVGNIKRRFDELAAYLFRSQRFPSGAVLLTGTGIVPPDDFTLQAGDVVDIEISGVGSMSNPVVVV
jgi:2-dehydro-3-deoxy-D-arabinonate dehydratase